MAALPQFPVFERSDHQLSRLQALAYAVQFSCRAPVIFHLYKTLDQTLPANTLTPVNWDASSADSDNGFAGGRYVAQTPGYFHCDFGVNIIAPVSDALFQVALRVTTGSGNPAGAGVVTYVAARADDTTSGAPQESLSASAATPYLYAGDILDVVAYCTQLTTIQHAWNNSGNNDANGFPDGSPSFTGMLISLGP